MAAAALWTTSAIEWALTARERRRQRQAAVDRNARPTKRPTARLGAEGRGGRGLGDSRSPRRPPAAAPPPAQSADARRRSGARACVDAGRRRRPPPRPRLLASRRRHRRPRRPAPAPSSTKAACRLNRSCKAPASRRGERAPRCTSASASASPPRIRRGRLSSPRLERREAYHDAEADRRGGLSAATDLVEVGVSAGGGTNHRRGNRRSTPRTESAMPSPGVHPENLVLPDLPRSGHGRGSTYAVLRSRVAGGCWPADERALDLGLAQSSREIHGVELGAETPPLTLPAGGRRPRAAARHHRPHEVVGRETEVCARGTGRWRRLLAGFEPGLDGRSVSCCRPRPSPRGFHERRI